MKAKKPSECNIPISVILIVFLVPIQGLLVYTFSLVTAVYNVSV